MPTLKHFGTSSVRIYADDHHPPHFHIVGVDFQVLVRISDLAILEGEAKSSQIAEALEWARMNREYIALKWAEWNERG